MKKFIIILCSLLFVSGCATSHLKNGDESVVTFNKGGISAQELYEVLKESYGAEALVDLIDTELLSKEYKKNDEEKNYIKQVISSLKDEWKDNFLAYAQSNYGVKDEDELEEYVRLSYRRNLWKNDYAKTLVTETQINDYYENEAVGDFEASHILITSKATSDMSDEEKKESEEEALKLAEEIITKLNDGEKFEDLAKEYSEDKANKDNGGKLGEKINDRSSYDENFLEAAIALDVDSYSTTPVKSQFGYHIILKTSQDKKAKLKDIEESIKAKIAQDLIKADSNFNAKAVLALREKYDIKITDNDLEKDYNELYGL